MCYLTCYSGLFIPSPVRSSPLLAAHMLLLLSLAHRRCARADPWTAREKQMRSHRKTFLAARKDSCHGNHLSPSQLRNPIERSLHLYIYMCFDVGQILFYI